jgi:small redox-active disulfide protein 2
MKNIKILGTGCAKCKQTEAIIRDTLLKNNIEAQVEKLEDIEKIMAYNIMTTPAIVVDEIVKFKGRVPSEQEILDMLK